MGELPFAFDRSSSQALRRNAEERKAASDRAESTNGQARLISVSECSDRERNGGSVRRTCALAPPKPNELTPAIRAPRVSGNGSSTVGTRSFRATKSMFGLG